MTETILSRAELNVGFVERWASVVFGGALTGYGLKMRSATGLALATIGGVLVWRGATGRCPVYESLGVSTAGHDTGETTNEPAVG